MSTKVILEEAVKDLNNIIKADEAWIEYIDGKVMSNTDNLISLDDRLDEIEAKMDAFVRVLEDLGKAVDALRP
jgi:hypothetical protein